MRTVGLKFKFVTGAVTLIIVLGLAVMIIIPLALSGILEQEFQKTSVYMTKDLALESIDPLLTERRMDLMLLLFLHEDANDDIEYIFIVEEGNKVVAHTFDGLFPEDLKEANRLAPDKEYSIQHLTTERGGIIDVAAPISNVELGTVHIGFSDRHVRESIDRIIQLIKWIFIAVLIIGGVIALVFARNLTRPIYELQKGVDAIGDGNLESRVNVQTTDEIGSLAGSFNRMALNLKTAKEELEASNEQLTEALTRVKILTGMLPICSICNKIRNDKGYGEKIADYISEHSEAEFTHGLCPDCCKKHYPEYFKGKD